MKEIQILLTPQPGARPEFLATVQAVDPSPAVTTLWEEHLPSTLVLEDYTRDGWAWKPAPGTIFQNMVVQSTDGRHKIPGFVNYLKGRQKCAYGRFGATGLCVVSYIQPKARPAETDHNKPQVDRLECRIALDLTQIPHVTLEPKRSSSTSTVHSTSQGASEKLATLAAAASETTTTALSSTTSTRKGGSGLLGKLVGAQQRTNHHVAVASTVAKPKASAAQAAVLEPSGSMTPLTLGRESSNGTTSLGVQANKTASQVLADFRQSMQEKMLDFDISSEEQLKVSISLAEYTAGLSDEDKEKVTMDILKYMVYEAAEEVNEDWIAYKEPTEFMDEAVFTIYKEGAAPEEVLEEINQGDLPDEIRGQERAIQAERQRQVSQKESQRKQKTELQAHRQLDLEEDNGDLEVLNTVKRDRRTIEDYEREKREQNSKRNRSA